MKNEAASAAFFFGQAPGGGAQPAAQVSSVDPQMWMGLDGYLSVPQENER